MKIQELAGRTADYATSVLAPKATSWSAKFALGVGSAAIAARAEGLVRAAGLVSPEGDVDLEALHAVVRSGFAAAGPYNLLGAVTIDPQDVEDLFAHLAT